MILPESLSAIHGLRGTCASCMSRAGYSSGAKYLRLCKAPYKVIRSRAPNTQISLWVGLFAGFLKY